MKKMPQYLMVALTLFLLFIITETYPLDKNCPGDRYAVVISGTRACLDCSSKCKFSEKETPCTATQDTICGCEEWQYWNDIAIEDGLCTNHSTCAPDQTVQKLGDKDSDTVCEVTKIIDSNNDNSKPKDVIIIDNLDQVPRTQNPFLPQHFTAGTIFMIILILGILAVIFSKPWWTKKICPKKFQQILQHCHDKH